MYFIIPVVFYTASSHISANSISAPKGPITPPLAPVHDLPPMPIGDQDHVSVQVPGIGSSLHPPVQPPPPVAPPGNTGPPPETKGSVTLPASGIVTDSTGASQPAPSGTVTDSTGVSQPTPTTSLEEKVKSPSTSETETSSTTTTTPAEPKGTATVVTGSGTGTVRCRL
jgi:hypothetical protein